MHKKLVILTALFILIGLMSGVPAVLAQSGSSDPAPGAPGVFTERVCQGDDALVYQGIDESGAGVTISTKDNWQCLEEATVLVIGPWGGSDQLANAHSACKAESRKEVDDMVERTGWVNGSVWRLMDDNIAISHPLVVRCKDVEVPQNGMALDTMGLNPHQSYIVPNELEWPFFRASQLLGDPVKRSAYCLVHSNEALTTNLLCPSWYEGYGQLFRYFAFGAP